MSGKGQVKMQDLAAVAGVSAMTVSRALRGVEGVSEAKRAEILSLARRLNYLPDMTARAMTLANSNLVGVALPTLFNDVFADVLSGMRGTFRSAGFASLVETTDYDPAQEREWVERLLSWRPAGIVLTGCDHSPDLRDRLAVSNVPVVEVWDWRSDPIDMCVGINHWQAGFDLGTHARALGYRRPAFIGARNNRDPRAAVRYQGVCEAFESQIPVARPEASNDLEAGMTGVRMLLADGSADLFFCLNDYYAVGALMVIQSMGLSVPGDVGLVGFNGMSLSTVLPIALTTLRTPRRQMGVLAARAILARSKGTRPERSVCLECEFVPGATVRQVG